MAVPGRDREQGGVPYTHCQLQHRRRAGSPLCTHHEISAAWHSPNGAKLVDVSCGAKYTVLIDNLREEYRLGGAKKRTEDRSSLPVWVEGLVER